MRKIPTCSSKDPKVDVKVLLVDDDAIVRLLHQKIVESSAPGLTVFTCKNGEEAVQLIESARSQNTRFLVLLDINMPVMNGWEFLKHCQKKQFNNILVVVVSSSINNADKRAAGTFPQVFRYCEKPLNKKDFIDITSQEEVASLLEEFLEEN